jgi:hypothetical protein
MYKINQLKSVRFRFTHKEIIFQNNKDKFYRQTLIFLEEILFFKEGKLQFFLIKKF